VADELRAAWQSSAAAGEAIAGPPRKPAPCPSSGMRRKCRGACTGRGWSARHWCRRPAPGLHFSTQTEVVQSDYESIHVQDEFPALSMTPRHQIVRVDL
jgi:hypothetical protein